ncbi:MAG: CatA-like O-acetyltransferase [Chloroflexota bacterium]|nr:CatA-like O-acetyltransferase [Chloroflexota bacterium]
MRCIHTETWSRCEQLKVYSRFDRPHFAMCANVDGTAFYPAVKQFGYSVNSAIVYVVYRAANAIFEFRQRECCCDNLSI